MRDIRNGASRKMSSKRFSPKPPFPEDLPPDVKELYEKYAHSDEPSEEGPEQELDSQEEAEEKEELVAAKPAIESPKVKFTGSKVPIANVHVSRQELSTKAKRVTRREHVSPPETPSVPPVKPKGRPLFAAPPTGASKPSKKPARQTMRLGSKDRKLVAILVLVVLVAAGLAAMLFLPRSNLTLTLATAPLLIDHAFTIQGSGITEFNAVAGQAIVREVPVEGSSAVSSTKIVGVKAAGTVRIVNRTFEQQGIKEGSRLVTPDGILYFMQSEAIVPPAEGSTLGVATVQVVADVAGPEGNLESGRLNFAALDSSAQTVVYAEVAQPITGGKGDEVRVVQDSDLEAAREEASRLALEQTIASAQLAEGYVLLDESREGEIIDFTTSVALEQEVETIPFTATVRAKVMAYQESALEDTLRKALEDQLDDDYMLFPAPLSYTKSVTAVDWERQEAQVTARVTHTTIPTFSLETLRDKLAGRSEAEAVEYLKGLPGVKSVEVELWPFWVRNIPRIEQRVAIELVPDRQP